MPRNKNLPATGAKLYVYVPDGVQLASGKPVIQSITPTRTVHFTGRPGLNGISQGAAYGDDAQMDSNYPIIQFKDTNNAHIDYGRTFDWSSTGVRTGAGSTEFSLPAGLIPQTYLVSSARMESSRTRWCFHSSHPLSSRCARRRRHTSVIAAPQPATYKWLRNGLPVNGQTSAQLTIVNATTNDAGNYTLQVTSGVVHRQPAVPVSVGILEVSQPPATNSAVLCQPTVLSVVARGKGTLSVQWFHNGNLIVPDSTSPRPISRWPMARRNSSCDSRKSGMRTTPRIMWC